MFKIAAPAFTLLLLTGCQPEPPAAPPPRIVLVQAASAAPGSGASYSGEIRARYEFDLAFRVGGKLAARLVDAGAEIKAGQPLARLDPADLQLAASAASAQLASASSDHATASAERERYHGLLAKKFVSQAAFEAKDNAYKATIGRLEQARAQAALSGNQAAYGTLSSEFPAIVTAVLAEAGQVVGAGQPLLRLARPEQKEIAIAVPEGRLAEFKSAPAFAVNLWADPKITLRGELRELAPAADPLTRSYAARIRLIDPPPAVRLGMTARVAVAASGNPELQVPLSAVIDQGQGPLVRVVVNGQVASRPVKTSHFAEDGVRISSGLQPGELVVVAGATRLVDGEAVQARVASTTERQR